MTRRLIGVLLGRCQSERANDLEVARRDQTRTSCRGLVVLVNQAAKTLQTSDAGRALTTCGTDPPLITVGGHGDLSQTEIAASPCLASA
jgi:hypothetical protein